MFLFSSLEINIDYRGDVYGSRFVLLAMRSTGCLREEIRNGFWHLTSRRQLSIPIVLMLPMAILMSLIFIWWWRRWWCCYKLKLLSPWKVVQGVNRWVYRFQVLSEVQLWPIPEGSAKYTWLISLISLYPFCPLSNQCQYWTWPIYTNGPNGPNGLSK